MVKGACSDVLDKVCAKVSSIPLITPNQNTTKELQNVAQIFDDFIDKDKRRNNIVVHNLQELQATLLRKNKKKMFCCSRKWPMDPFI